MICCKNVMPAPKNRAKNSQNTSVCAKTKTEICMKMVNFCRLPFSSTGINTARMEAFSRKGLLGSLNENLIIMKARISVERWNLTLCTFEGPLCHR